jgi:hypothetical protein
MCRERCHLARICLLCTACFLMADFVCFQGVAAAGEKKAIISLVSMAQCCPDKYWADAEKAVLDEFSTLNTEMQVVEGVATDSSEWNKELAAIAIGKGADCALRIYGSSEGQSGGVDLWVTDADTGEVTSRHIPLGATTDSEAASIATLRSLEAIRAVLIAYEIKPPDEKEEAPIEPTKDLHEDEDAGKIEIKNEIDTEPSSAFGVGLGMGI